MFRCAPAYFFGFLFESKGIIQPVPHLAGHLDLSDVSIALRAFQRHMSEMDLNRPDVQGRGTVYPFEQRCCVPMPCSVSMEFLNTSLYSNLLYEVPAVLEDIDEILEAA